MVGIKKAKDLLKSAEDLYAQQDLAGVVGLAYQALESGIMVLGEVLNKKSSLDHLSRRKLAEDLLGASKTTMKRLWLSRNIDFYGNESVGAEEKELTAEEVKEALDTVRDLIYKIEKLIAKQH